MSAPAFATGLGYKLITTVSLPSHVPLDPVRIYAVVIVGEATGEAITTLLREGSAFQAYVAAPEPFRETDAPGQILASLPAFTAGRGFTNTMSVSVSMHPAAVLTVTW
jgi:hypothetical protein